MEIQSHPIRGIGVDKDGKLDHIILLNGTSQFYKVEEMKPSDFEKFHGTDIPLTTKRD